jgi:hypothetical protein
VQCATISSGLAFSVTVIFCSATARVNRLVQITRFVHRSGSPKEENAAICPLLLVPLYETSSMVEQFALAVEDHSTENAFFLIGEIAQSSR